MVKGDMDILFCSELQAAELWSHLGSSWLISLLQSLQQIICCDRHRNSTSLTRARAKVGTGDASEPSDRLLLPRPCCLTREARHAP